MEMSELALIVYPGIVKNVERALENLGGMSKIEQQHFSDRSLDLSHHPSNSFHRPLQSERRQGDNIHNASLLFAVRVRRRRRREEEGAASEASIIGAISVLYTFKSLCDFQYLPVSRDGEGQWTEMLAHVIPTSIPDALTWWDRKPLTDTLNDPTLLLPFQFSRFSTPSPYMLCRDVDQREAKQEGKKQNAGQNMRAERKALSVTVNGDEHFPDVPSEEAIHDANIRCRNEEPHRLLTELFRQRPLWTRQAIVAKTALDEAVLKILLPKYAFYIQSGPWGRLWCRFGYDPRREPSARQFQTVMVSFKRHKKIPERPRLRLADRTSVALQRKAGTREATRSQEDTDVSWRYLPGQLPTIRQMWYSLCDVGLQIATDYLAVNYEPPSHEADAQHGWLPSEAMDNIRNEIKNDVKRTSQLIDAVAADDAADEDDDMIDDAWLD